MVKTLKNPIRESKTQPQVFTAVSEYDGVLYPNFHSVELCKIMEMRKHPTVTLARQLVVAPVLAAQWIYTDTDDAPEGAKEFIEKQLAPFRMHLLRTTFQGFIDYGWTPYEKIFKICRDGMIGIKKLKPLLQELTDILVNPKTGAYRGLKQPAYNTVHEVKLSVGETLLVAIDVDGTDWYGNSVFKSTEVAYDQYEVCRKGADRYDRKLAGSHWIIHYPPGSSEYNGEEDVSNASSSFIERLKYLDSLIVRTFGVPERAVLEGSFGTKAEADTHGDAAVINMDMRHRLAVVTYNQHLVNHLLRINYGEDFEDTVYIEPAPLDNTQRKMLATIYDRVLQSPEAGPEEVYKINTEALKEDLGIPVKDDYEETLRSLQDVLYPEKRGDGIRED